MNSLKENIQILHNRGFSYNKISIIIGCAKGTICYHLNSSQKEKTNNRAKKYKKNRHPLIKRIETFHVRVRGNTKKVPLKKWSWECTLKSKIYAFFNRDRKKILRGTMEKTYFKLTFNIKDVFAKFGQITQCYLTGEIIDLSKPETYQLDHKIPWCKGGNATLDNLGICTPIANQAKNAMTPDELIEFCKKVLTHHGYEINEK